MSVTTEQPKPYFQNETSTLYFGDCLAVLPLLPENSIDAVVTDPPYDLTAGKKGGTGEASVNLDSPYGRSRITTGFMGKVWDGTGIAFNPETWKAVMRVMRPGAHLLAFGGTRTYARMVCAMEESGLEVRDEIDFWYDANPIFAEFYNSLTGDQKALLHQSAGASHLSWEYGSGFPKSLNVQRAIDSELCVLPGRHYWAEQSLPKGDKAKPSDHVCAFTEMGAQHEAEGTALKPAHEPIVLARKPIANTVASNVLEHGTGGLNVDGCRIQAIDFDPKERIGATKLMEDRPWNERPRIQITEGNDLGRWPANLILSHSEGCQLIGTKKAASNGHYPSSRGQGGLGTVGHSGQDDLEERTTKDETIEEWRCVESCAVLLLNEQSGDLQGGASQYAFRSGLGYHGGSGTEADARIDYPGSGGASRFFYCSKASAEDREEGLEDIELKQRDESRKEGNPGGDNPRNRGLSPRKNHHPTVKSTELMQWLCRLITPPGGTVLDPFMGSGSTGKAAYLEGLRFIGIEQDESYCQIAARRCAVRQRSLFAASEVAP